jgi:Xaa-Pro aminopeptidase
MKNLQPNFANRIKRVRSLFSSWNVDGLIVFSPIDIYYLTGHTISTGTYIIGKKDTYLFVDGRYFEQLKSDKHVYPNSELETACKKLSFKKLGFDAKQVSFFDYQKLKKQHKELIPLDRPVMHIRAVKDEYELYQIAKACALATHGVQWIIDHLRVGVQEKELASRLEIFFKLQGADKLSFSPIIAFGEHSAYPHYRAGTARLKKNQHVQIDIGVCLNGYHSDISRVHFFGKPSPKIQEITQIVERAQKTAIKQCKAGMTADTLDQMARSVIEQAGYKEFFVHGLGHGVGLDIHELPAVKKEQGVILQENMVITIEPGIYLPGIGGARIEDTVIVQKSGCKLLTKKI